jgi:hypothetical protein
MVNVQKHNICILVLGLHKLPELLRPKGRNLSSRRPEEDSISFIPL